MAADDFASLAGTADTAGALIFAGLQAVPPTLFDRPVVIGPNMPAPAPLAKSLAFGDWKRAYGIRRVRGICVQKLTELYASTGQLGWIASERVDGRPLLAAAAGVPGPPGLRGQCSLRSRCRLKRTLRWSAAGTEACSSLGCLHAPAEPAEPIVGEVTWDAAGSEPRPRSSGSRFIRRARYLGAGVDAVLPPNPSHDEVDLPVCADTRCASTLIAAIPSRTTTLSACEAPLPLDLGRIQESPPQKRRIACTCPFN